MGTLRLLLILISTAYAFTPAYAAPTAFLVNGGYEPNDNYCIFYKGIQAAQTVLSGWSTQRFLAGGPNSTGPDRLACDGHNDASGLPALERANIKGQYFAATRSALKARLAEKIRHLKPGDPVIFYFNDHGDHKGGKSYICLWGEHLSLAQFKSLIAMVPSTNRVITVHDHCFSGGMLNAVLAEARHRPPGQTCGFSTASSDEFGFTNQVLMLQAQDILQNPSASVRANVDTNHDGKYSFGEIFRYIQSKDTSSSTPEATSDVFLKHYMATHHNLASKNENYGGIVSDCIMNTRTINLVGSGVSKNLAVLLSIRLSRIGSSLLTAYANAKVPQNISTGQVGRIFSEKRKILDDAMAAYMKAKSELSRAIYQFVRHKHPAIASKYERHFNLLAKLRSRLASVSPSQRGYIEHAIERQIHDGQSASTSFHRYLKAAKNGGTSQMKQWIAAHGGRPPAPFGSDILTRFSSLKRKAIKAEDGIHSIRRLNNTLTAFNGLKAIINSGDTHAMSQYLGLLQCEATPIGRMPGDSN